MSYKIWLCRFTGGYTNIIFTYSSFVALQCAWKERVNSRWLNWILRATILGSHWNMHELRILRLLHRRVFWKCDFSCDYLSYLPVFLCFYCTLSVAELAAWMFAHARNERPGASVTGDCSAVTTAQPCVGPPRSPVASAARPDTLVSECLCVQGCCCRAAWCRWARCSRAAWSCSRATDSRRVRPAAGSSPH